MKRSEFINEVICWGELLDVCNENSLDACEDVVSEDYRDEYIDDMLVDLARNNSWRDLMSTLNQYDEDSGYDYYRYDDYYGIYRPLDGDDFYEYKNSVLEEMDENEYWDPEDDQVEEGEEQSSWSSDPGTDLEEDCFEFTDDEECSMDDMLSSGVGCIRELSSVVDKMQDEAEENEDFIVVEEDEDFLTDSDIIF